jgi:nucleotide-binding universal stress UspA family protein
MRRLVEQAGGELEPVIVFGEPADEIAKVAEIRAAGLVVMGLQQRGSGRVGVVAYRILTSTHVPVLAIPAVMSIGIGADGTRAGQKPASAGLAA